MSVAAAARAVAVAQSNAARPGKAALVNAIKASFSRVEAPGIKFTKVSPKDPMPASVKAEYGKQVQAHRDAHSPGEDLMPVIQRGTFKEGALKGQTFFSVSHQQSTTGNKLQSFFAEEGAVLARRVSTERDGWSWAH